MRYRHGFPRHEEDIFSAVGGLELGPDAELDALGADLASGGHEPHSEPTRTLLVRHINPSASDDELLATFKVSCWACWTAEPSRGPTAEPEAADRFPIPVSTCPISPQVFGDVRHIYTVSKHRGIVMVSYFDLRSAARAQASLNGVPINGNPLEVQFCTPKGDPTVNQVGLQFWQHFSTPRDCKSTGSSLQSACIR